MKWINVNDRLPPEQDFNECCNKSVLVYLEGYGPKRAMYMSGEFYKDYTAKYIVKVTHWMDITNP